MSTRPPLEPGAPVALVPRARIGDALLALVVAENLRRAGHPVRVVSEALCELREWLPGLDVLDPRDTAACERARAECALVVHQNRDSVEGLEPRSGAVLVLGEDPAFDRSLPRAHAYAELCRARFGVTAPTHVIGLTPPEGASDPMARGRIVLHPGSREPRKAWPADRFFALSEALAARDLAPLWLVPPEERARWELFVQGGHDIASRERLADLAALLAGARLFVGNDSGVGHLASCVGAPTVTLFVRQRLARHWHPAWAPGAVVLPSRRLPGTWLQTRTWHRFVSVADVLAACERLLSETALPVGEAVGYT